MTPQTARKLKILGSVLLLGFIILMGAVTARRAAKGSNDFDTYYHAGKTIREGGSIYYSEAGRFQYQFTEERGPFLYPPFAAVFFIPLSFLPIKIAGFIWSCWNIAAFAVCLYLLRRLLFPDKARISEVLKKLPRSDLLIAAFLTGAILIDNLAMAQINLTVFLFMLLSIYLRKKEKCFRAGLALSAAVLLKVTPLLLLFYFIWKRSYRVAAGAVLGALLFTLIIPTLVLGLNGNRIMHRQWAGRTIKPILVEFFKERNADHVMHFDSLKDKFRHDRFVGRMTPKNQSIEGMVMRVGLKNRREYAYDHDPAVYPVRRYIDMPVLFGGLPRSALETLIRGLQAVLGLLLLSVWWREKRTGFERIDPEFVCISLICISMTLLPPWVRSHQFVLWFFPIGLFLSAASANVRGEGTLRLGLRFCALFYILQALPYGKAAGMGTLASLSLAVSFFIFFFFAAETREKNDPEILKAEDFDA